LGYETSKLIAACESTASVTTRFVIFFSPDGVLIPITLIPIIHKKTAPPPKAAIQSISMTMENGSSSIY
jgi:hypothetical protein